MVGQHARNVLRWLVSHYTRSWFGGDQWAALSRSNWHLKRDPRALILECTFDSFRSVAEFHAPTWAFLVPRDRLASAQRIPLVTCPVFQTHGTADRVVPYKSGQTLFAAANEPKVFVKIPDADHNSPTPLSIYSQIDQFIDEKCPKSTEP